MVWEIVNGPIPEDLHVLHRCDNPPCVRPDHLFVGTNADNVRDRQQKGRTARGERSATSRLSEEQVLSIREEYATGGVLMTDLAARYKVGYSTINAVIHGHAWTHLAGATSKSLRRAQNGENNRAAKLTQPEVDDLRAASARGETGKSLAARYGVSRATVSLIINRKNWSHS